MNRLLIIWIALAVVFAAVEAATAQIVTLWFAVGSVGAIVANVLGANATVQLIVFVALSLLTLAVARPYFKRFIKTNVQPTNSDMCLGQEAVVTEEINNLLGQGQAKIKGVIWTARSADESVIPKDSVVTVKAIEGVKLIVEKK